MINDPVNNLQIKLFEGPDSFINFALPKKFDERLSLARPGRRIWEEPEYQRMITSQSVAQLPEHLPKNRPLDLLEYNVPEAAIRSEIGRNLAYEGRLHWPTALREERPDVHLVGQKNILPLNEYD